MAAVAGALGEADEVGGGRGEHESALAIEVAGDGVQGDDQPRHEAAELLGTGADAAVRDRRGRIGEFTGQKTDIFRGDAGVLRRAFGREVVDGLAQRQKAVGERLDTAEPHPVLLEQDVQDREQQKRVGPGPDGEVLVGR